MFRRSNKNPFEDVQALYEEESTTHPGYSSYPRSEHLAPTPSLFDVPKTTTNYSITSPTPEEPQTPNWSSTTSEIHIPSLTEEPETTLGEGVTFKGELAFDRLLRIDGSFEGVLVSNGKIIIGPKGYVKADINLKAAVIEGTVEGNITVKEKLELRGGASVKGDIQASSLCVDEGVQLTGYVSIVSINQNLQEEEDLAEL